MTLLKQLFKFYVFSNIHVAFATFCLTKITMVLYGLSGFLVPFFVFFSTVVAYSFLRFYRISAGQNWLNKFLKKENKASVALAVLSAVMAAYLFFLLDYKTWLILVPFLLCTLFYVVPIPTKNNKQVTLRGISFLKLFLIGITWAGVTVLMPLVNGEVPIERSVMITLLQRFLLVVAITIPFDIRDVNHDSETLKTIPQTLGIYKSKVIGLICLMAFLVLAFFSQPFHEELLRINLIVATISLLFLLRSSEKQTLYYSAFFVESIPIIWFLLIYFSTP